MAEDLNISSERFGIARDVDNALREKVALPEMQFS